MSLSPDAIAAEGTVDRLGTSSKDDKLSLRIKRPLRGLETVSGCSLGRFQREPEQVFIFSPVSSAAFLTRAAQRIPCLNSALPRISIAFSVMRSRLLMQYAPHGVVAFLGILS